MSERDPGSLADRLLASAQQDQPSSEARRRAAVALGLAVPLAPLPSPSGPAGAPATPGAPVAGPVASSGSLAGAGPAAGVGAGALPAAAPMAAKVGAGLALKWALAVVVVGGGALGVIQPWSPAAPRPAEPAARDLGARVPEAAAPTLEAAPDLAPVLVSEPAEAELRPPEVVPAKRPAPRPKAQAIPRPAEVALAPTPDPPTLAEETVLLDQARAAFAAQDASALAGALGRYQARCPEGRLAPEAELLGIDLQLLRGDVAAARTLGERFLEAHPDRSLPQRQRRAWDPAP